MISTEGHVKIGDLGLLSAVRKHMRRYDFQTLTSVLTAKAVLPGAGTMFFMPPEAIERKWNRSADVWAVAGVAIFCITKEIPYMFEYKSGAFVVDIIKQGKLPNAFLKVR